MVLGAALGLRAGLELIEKLTASRAPLGQNPGLVEDVVIRGSFSVAALD